nr:RND transporter [Rickettsia hoogstraalii]
MRGKTVSFDEAISGYLTRLPRSLQSLAMTARCHPVA